MIHDFERSRTRVQSETDNNAKHCHQHTQQDQTENYNTDSTQKVSDMSPSVLVVRGSGHWKRR
jgi:hypothetical protein